MASTKITRMTPEQEALLGVRYEEWLRVGLNTEPADRPRAEAAISEMYRAVGAEPPSFFWVPSPLSAQLAIDILHRWAAGDLEKVELRDQLRDQLRAQLGDQLRDQLRAQLWDQLGDQLRDQLGDQLGDQLWAQLGDQLRDQLRAQLWAQLGDQLRDQLRAQLGDQLGDQLWDQLWDQKIPYRGTWFWGQQDSYWIAFYRFAEELGVTYPAEAARRLALHEDVARSCMWLWPYKGICVMCDRPEIIARDDRNRLHSDTGPAVKFRDGWSIWANHGVRVPQRVIEDAQSLTPAEIREERNVEIRRVMLERFGTERYLRESNAQKVHSDEWGTLWRVDMPDDEPVVMVEVVNSTAEPDGTFKDYWLRVPPNITTARAAVAWTFDVPPTKYAPLVET